MSTLKDIVKTLCRIEFVLCKIEFVPELYRGKFDFEKIKSLAGKSKIDNKTINEGVVITSEKESICKIGRKTLKYVFDHYLIREGGSEFK